MSTPDPEAVATSGRFPAAELAYTHNRDAIDQAEFRLVIAPTLPIRQPDLYAAISPLELQTNLAFRASKTQR